jgi:hypothetical protein
LPFTDAVRQAPIKVSIVDTSPVVAGSTAVEVFRTTVELAQLADQCGFLAVVAQGTAWRPNQRQHHAGGRRRRRGVKNTQPARRLWRGRTEQSQPVPGRRDVPSITPMFLGRIDLGIGRATSGRLIDFALQKTRSAVLPTRTTRTRSMSCCTGSRASMTTTCLPRRLLFESVAGRPEPWILLERIQCVGGRAPRSGVLLRCVPEPCDRADRPSNISPGVQVVAIPHGPG